MAKVLQQLQFEGANIPKLRGNSGAKIISHSRACQDWVFPGTPSLVIRSSRNSRWYRRLGKSHTRGPYWGRRGCAGAFCQPSHWPWFTFNRGYLANMLSWEILQRRSSVDECLEWYWYCFVGLERYDSQLALIGRETVECSYLGFAWWQGSWKDQGLRVDWRR